jgi:glutamyl-tRNA synthetase
MSVRVRFAPSPTGGLHLGGVRTVLYNYLFAKHHGGQFILRIEDTDQSRYVPGAEEYIYQCLDWCGLVPDESPVHGGSFGPYRQSERKESYRRYAEELVEKGFAYYAFDTPEELDQMRQQYASSENPNPQYDHTIRKKMRNSLSLTQREVKELMDQHTPHVIRIKMPENEIISFEDMIRGTIQNETGLVDDKVLLKADGMPTYHLAVVVDDYLMKITHAFRGEEWLPSAPVHVLLWRYLGWEDEMPQWAHLPLILGPNGKLSKRDGAKYGFPVFAMNWADPKSGELTEGFKEKGFLPQAFVNLLALLGWNDGTEKELYSIDELILSFDMNRVHKGGAKFDYEKARWFNQEWVKKIPTDQLSALAYQQFQSAGWEVEKDEKFDTIIELVKDRCVLLFDFLAQAGYFYKTPEERDLDAIKAKWNESKNKFFLQFADELNTQDEWNFEKIEEKFKQHAEAAAIKPGELQLPFRIMLVGGKFGPAVFRIAELLGKEETIARIRQTISAL